MKCKQVKWKGIGTWERFKKIGGRSLGVEVYKYEIQTCQEVREWRWREDRIRRTPRPDTLSVKEFILATCSRMCAGHHMAHSCFYLFSFLRSRWEPAGRRDKSQTFIATSGHWKVDWSLPSKCQVSFLRSVLLLFLGWKFYSGLTSGLSFFQSPVLYYLNARHFQSPPLVLRSKEWLSIFMENYM